MGCVSACMCVHVCAGVCGCVEACACVRVCVRGGVLHVRDDVAVGHLHLHQSELLGTLLGKTDVAGVGLRVALL